MFDLNWKTAIIVVVLLVGGMFELIKNLPVKGSSNWSIDGFRLGGDNAPYSVKAARAAGAQLPKRVAYKAPQTGGLNLAAQMEKFAKLNAVQQSEAPAPAVKEKGAEGADDFEIYIDPKTGKMMKKKKKKKKEAKKKDEEKNEDTALAQEIPDFKEERPEAAPQGDSYYTGTVQQQQPKQDQAKKAPVFGSAEDWMARLLGTPDPKETRRFIQAYNSGLVTAAVFYKIVDAMVADQRVEMRTLGVLCLSQTPSVKSFETLAKMQERENINTELAADINRGLEHYTKLENLRILEKLLTNENGYTTILAVQKVDQAAAQHLGAEVGGAANPAPAPTPDPENPNVYSTSVNAKYFTKFLTLLNGLIAARDLAVAEQAQRTLAELQTRLQPAQITAAME